MGWIGFVASVVIALIVGSIFKVFKEARGGNLFAALIGAQLGILLVHGATRLARGIVAVLCAIVVSWLLSLGGESGEEIPESSPKQNP